MCVCTYVYYVLGSNYEITPYYVHNMDVHTYSTPCTVHIYTQVLVVISSVKSKVFIQPHTHTQQITARSLAWGEILPTSAC